MPCQVLLIVWLAGSLLAEGPVPRLAETAGGSTAVRTMAGILPPPTEVAVELGGWLDTTGLPDVFVGFEPVPAPPVDRPDDPAARAIAAAAEASTLKVTAATCGLSSVGTGFVVAHRYVVTNAHVVAGAGARGIRVSTARGEVHDAVPVLVDPAFDIAVLYVDDLQASPLFLAAPGSGSRRDRRHPRIPGRRPADDPAGRGRRAGTRRPDTTSTPASASVARSSSCVRRSIEATAVAR